MTKITLTDLANLQNENTAVSAINSNNATIEVAFDNTLSRDGTNPNEMGANLDMNSNRILNLPLPATADEPVRLQDLANYATGGSVVFNALPTGGPAGSNLIKNSSANYDAVWGGNALFFDKRSDVTASRIPTSITSIVISRYDTGYPICPAVYIRSASIGTGLVLTDAGGATWDLQSTAGIVYAYPDWFGAKHDGTTDDCPAIRSCMSYLKNYTPSTMYFSAGTYLLGSVSSSVAFFGYSGVNIIGQGDSTVLKIKTNIAAGASFYMLSQVTQTVADRIDGTTYADFKVDGNSAGNNFNVYMAGIGLPFGFNNTIRNVYFQNWCGSQCISLGVSSGIGGVSTTPASANPRVINCRFLDTAVSNSFITDFSNIYAVASDYIITGNWCTQSNITSIGTAIEVHGTGVCNGNTIRNHNQGFNVGAYPDSNSTLINNTLYQVAAFGTIWETLGGANPNYATKCIIADNIVFMNNSAKHGIDMSNSSGVSNSYVKIINNYFESLEAAGTASTAAVIMGAKMKDVEVVGNTAVNFATPLYFQLVEPVADTQVLKIHDNVIIDCGRGSNAAVRQGINVSCTNKFNVISICNNIIKNTSTVYMTTGILGTAGVTTTFGRCRIYDNTMYNITTNYNWTGTGRVEGIWVTYTATLSSGSGAPGGGNTVVAKYRILSDNSMTIQSTVLIGAAGIGTAGNDVIISLPFTCAINSAVSGKEITVSGKTQSGSALATASVMGWRNYDNTTAWANNANFVVTAEIQI